MILRPDKNLKDISKNSKNKDSKNNNHEDSRKLVIFAVIQITVSRV